MNEQAMLSLVSLFVAGAAAQWLAWRLRIPAILLLLGTGLAAGPGLGWIRPDELFGDLLLPGVSLGVAVILFEGGLGLRFRELAGLHIALARFLTLGVVITLFGVAVAARHVLLLEWPIAFALGAILTVTGPTVIGPLLRDIRLTGKVSTLLRWEGIVIDPIGALLAAVVILIVRSGASSPSPADLLGELAGTVVVGVSFGSLAAGCLILMMRRFWVPDRLVNPITLAIVFGVFAAANRFYGEAGLVAATAMGVVLANQSFVSIKSIVEFKETLVVILLFGLFVVIGSRIHPQDIFDFGSSGLGFIACLVLFVRPLAVLASTAGSELTTRERWFLAGMAPRGVVAVSIASVFGIELAQAEVPGADRLLSAAVLSVIGTVSIYGLAAKPLAKWLGLVESNPQGILFVGASDWVCSLAKSLQNAGVVVRLVDTDWENVATARMLGLTAVYGSILSEQLIEELDTGKLRRIVAMTPNAELNALACHRFAEIFGRAEIFHVSSGPDSGRHTTLSREQGGREILDSHWTYAKLAQHFDRNGTTRATGLTAEFGFEEWQKRNGEIAIPVFLKKKDGAIVPFTKSGPKPQQGDTVFALYANATVGPSSAGKMN